MFSIIYHGLPWFATILAFSTDKNWQTIEIEKEIKIEAELTLLRAWHGSTVGIVIQYILIVKLFNHKQVAFETQKHQKEGVILWIPLRLRMGIDFTSALDRTQNSNRPQFYSKTDNQYKTIWKFQYCMIYCLPNNLKVPFSILIPFINYLPFFSFYVPQVADSVVFSICKLNRLW